MLTQLLADEANVGYDSDSVGFDVVNAVNGVPVPSMAALVQARRGCGGLRRVAAAGCGGVWVGVWIGGFGLCGRRSGCPALVRTLRSPPQVVQQQRREAKFLEFSLQRGEAPQVLILSSDAVNGADGRILDRYKVPSLCSSHFQHLL